MNHLRPRFTDQQRAELASLGLLTQQIDSLEDDALRLGAFALRNEDQAPTRADVIAEFDKIADALEAARRALSALEAARDDVPAHTARVKVRRHIELASYGMGAGIGDEGLCHEVLYQVAALRAIVRRAKAVVPKGPTRHKTAAPYPVSLIEQALLKGWIAAHHDQPRPALNCPASKALKAPFRRVVQLCYEAMGRPNEDPDRAINGFMTWKRKQVQNTLELGDVPS